MMSKTLGLIGLMVCFGFTAFSQERIVALVEQLASIGIGESKNEVSYESTEEGFYSPNGPMVDQLGRLLFFPTAGFGSYETLLVFENEKGFFRMPLFSIMRSWQGLTEFEFVSQSGLIQLNNVFIDPSISTPDGAFYPQSASVIPVTKEARYYPMPFGSYMESVRPAFAYSTEVLKDRSIKVRNAEDTRSWLPNQPGGFSIGDDGLLYRNAQQWSATIPSELYERGYSYLGRLASGHVIWCGGQRGMEKEFVIATPRGKIELRLDFPWAPQYDIKEYRPFNYGLGPWGEFYCLLGPIARKGIPWPPKDGRAELVVVRNHLKYFGRLNDSNVRLRKDPTTNAEIVGTYPAKTGFRIIEKGDKEETIAGQTNYWYHVRLLDGKEGWFFGAFVQNLYDGPNGKPPPWPNVPDW